VSGNQTVPRAELTAVCIILGIAAAPLITIIVDAIYIIKGFERGPRRVLLYANADLWGRFWELVQGRGGPKSVKFNKIKSHLTSVEVACGVAPLDEVILNEGADAFAEIAATEHAASNADVQAIASADKRTWVVQKRMLAVLTMGARCQLDRARGRGGSLPVID